MATIHVIGLGPGDQASLPLGTLEQLRSGLPVYFRTFIHPAVDVLHAEGISATSFDSVYDEGENIDDLYPEMARQLISAAADLGDIVYAVPGHPLMAEQSVQLLLTEAPKAGIDVRIGAGHSFLDAVCSVLHIDPIEGLSILDAMKLRMEAFQPSLHTLIVQVFNRDVASDVKLSLMEVLPDEYPVQVVRAAGVPGMEECVSVPLYDLDKVELIDHLTTVYVPPTDNTEVLRGEPWYAHNLVRKLREPDGCPWDREQTHTTLRPYVLEEAYEVAEAIDEGDEWALADELGDLLLQVLLHSQIGSEEGTFNLRDVYGALSDKLIRRHPHVFGEVTARSAEEAEQAWTNAKAAETSPRTSEAPTQPSQTSGDDAKAADSQLDAGNTQTERPSALTGVKWAAPAIAASLSVQRAAAKVGFDWDGLDGVFAKVQEELDELAEALGDRVSKPQNGLTEDVPDAVVEEFGDLMLTVVNLGRLLRLDVEQSLSLSNRKFARRFAQLEKFLQKNGQDFDHTTPSELNCYWNQIKEEEKSLASDE